MTKIKSIAGNCTLVLFGIIVSLLLAEGILRLVPRSASANFGADRGFFSHFDPHLGWRASPSVTGLHTAHGFSVQVEQNSLGLRAPENTVPERRDDDYRVLVLGDSYIWGYGADQKDLFSEPAVHGQTDLELINFGVSGYGTDQELLWYRNSGKQFDVDEVILAFTPYNDVSNNLKKVAYGYDKPQFELQNGALHQKNSEIRDRTQRRWWNSLLRDSRVGSLVNAAALNYKYASLQATDADNGVADALDRIRRPDQLSEKDFYGLDLTVAIIEELNKEVSAADAKLTVTFIPYKPHVLAGVEDNHPFVPILMERLTELGIANFDPYQTYLSAAEMGETLYNARDNHFNASGHKLFSKVLVEHLNSE